MFIIIIIKFVHIPLLSLRRLHEITTPKRCQTSKQSKKNFQIWSYFSPDLPVAILGRHRAELTGNGHDLTHKAERHIVYHDPDPIFVALKRHQ